MSWTLLEGDCRELLRGLPAETVHCVVTSPPYWGLRAYGTTPQVWGGVEGCSHDWTTEKTSRPNSNGGPSTKQSSNAGSRVADYTERATFSDFCRHCNAWRGELGLEPTLELFIEHMVEVFREVKRVLRKDGTLWLNIGDSYAGTPCGRSAAEVKASGEDDRTFRDKPFSTVGGSVKPKDLCMIPARLALALQADGWWVRSDIIWSKPNPMPESITDRPTKAHEYVFLLTRSERYFYDADAVREPHTEVRKPWVSGTPPVAGRAVPGTFAGYHPGGRNKRSVWEVATQAFPEAHFATYPEELVRPCILAGTSERGCCPTCGAPWVRVVEKSRTFESGSGRSGNLPNGKNGHGMQGGGGTLDIRRGPCVQVETKGWAPSCKCPDQEPIPCVVLDPFGGSGTTSAVAIRHGRRAIACELNPEYAEIHRRRVSREEGLFTEPVAAVSAPAPVAPQPSLFAEALP